MNKIASYLLLSALITNNPYAPDCYTSTTTIHMGEMKKKKKEKKKNPSRFLGNVVHQHTTTSLSFQ